MRLDDLPESGNVEDRRDEGGGGFGGFGRGGGFGGCPAAPAAYRSAPSSCSVLISWALGIDPSVLDRWRGNSHRRRPATGGAAIRSACRPARRRMSRPLRFARARQHRSNVEGYFRQGRQDLSCADAGLYRGADPGALRHCADRDGAVLLPERSEGLSRHLVLQRDRDAVSRLQRQRLPVLAGLCDRARGRPPRAEPARHPAACGKCTALGRQQGGSQPHPGARRAAGGLLRRRLGEA